MHVKFFYTSKSNPIFLHDIYKQTNYLLFVVKVMAVIFEE